MDYLVSEGYPEAAEKFAQETKILISWLGKSRLGKIYLFAITFTWKACANLERPSSPSARILEPILRLVPSLGAILGLVPAFASLGWTIWSLQLFPRTCKKLLIALYLFFVINVDIRLLYCSHIKRIDGLPEWDSALLSGPVYPTPPPIGLQYIGWA